MSGGPQFEYVSLEDVKILLREYAGWATMIEEAKR